MPRTHRIEHHRPETHRSHRSTWLRAAVLGADDGIVSTAALMLGVAAANAGTTATVTAGVAGLVAGAMSMAAGEYVSVSSQRDAERADLEKERLELEHTPEAELRELTEIYVRRGLDRPLAATVARQMHDHDALGAHLRDELGLDVDRFARPLQASLTSAATFAAGAVLPVLAALTGAIWVIVVVALLALVALGAAGARVGDAAPGRGAARVLLGGGLAMAVTAGIGAAIGAVV